MVQRIGLLTMWPKIPGPQEKPHLEGANPAPQVLNRRYDEQNYLSYRNLGAAPAGNPSFRMPAEPSCPQAGNEGGDNSDAARQNR